MTMLHFNHTAVLASALLQWLIALLWYSPIFFGGVWKSAIDLPAESRMTRMIRSIIVALIGNLLVSFVLLHVIVWADVEGLRRTVLLSFGLWAGFIFAPFSAQYIYENRPVKLFAVNTGYWLVAILASCLLLIHMV